MKLFMKLVMVLIAVAVVLVLARNPVIKVALETGARVAAGMPLSIQKFDLDILNTSLDIEGLVLKNPSGFHDTALVDIPKILVAYERGSIFSGKVHLKDIEFGLKQFTVVKNEKGELNLDRLKALQGTQKTTPREKAKTPAKPIPIQIDRMRLKIGKVVYMDYSGGQASTKEFLINLDQTYRDITDLNSVVRLIVLKAMMSSGISNLVNFDIAGLQGSVTDALNSSAKMATEAAVKGLGTLKNAAGDPSQIAGQAGDALKGTAGAVKDAASSLKKLNPFAKSE